MAIIVEDENKKKGGVAVLGWLTVIVILVLGAYYIFFSSPSGAQVVTPPSNFQELTSLSQITVSPQDVIASSSFQSLKTYVAQPASSSPAAVGRTDPFVAP